MYSCTLSLTSEWMGWMISATIRRLYHRERDLDCTGGWVGPGTGLDGCGKSLHRDSIPGQSSPQRVATPSSSINFFLSQATLQILCSDLTTTNCTWTSPEKQPTQWVFKILFANRLIWSENSFIKTLTHKKNAIWNFETGSRTATRRRRGRQRPIDASLPRGRSLEPCNILHGPVTQPVSWVGEPGNNLMTAVGRFFTGLAFACRFIDICRLKS
jgi:hypothetical protein